jgi:hypothetical protein
VGFVPTGRACASVIVTMESIMNEVRCDITYNVFNYVSGVFAIDDEVNYEVLEDIVREAFYMTEIPEGFTTETWDDVLRTLVIGIDVGVQNINNAEVLMEEGMEEYEDVKYSVHRVIDAAFNRVYREYVL